MSVTVNLLLEIFKHIEMCDLSYPDNLHVNFGWIKIHFLELFNLDTLNTENMEIRTTK